MSERPKQPATRADRILDAAGALLLRMGYRKVTIEDIARQAGIGKGTVYLHWSTKEQLFEALLIRESADLTEELLDLIRADPTEVRPHRMARSTYLAIARRPLMAALTTEDTELLGKLKDGPLRERKRAFNKRYLDLMNKRGLFRDDVPNLVFALQATHIGFYLAENMMKPIEVVPELEVRADALAHTFRHAFEPVEEPSPATLAAVASELILVAEDLVASWRESIYAPEPPTETG